MKQQVVILKIKYDDQENFAPQNWNWSELLGCKNDCVQVMNYGTIEELPDE
jgi:hypothetical protein